MSIDPLRLSWQPLGAGTPGPVLDQAVGSTGTEADRARVAELAREFEATFIFQIVRQMRMAIASEEQEDGFGASTMTDTIDVELARCLAQKGGIGLASILGTGISRQITPPVTSVPDGNVAVSALSAAIAPGLPVVTPAPSGEAEGAAVPMPLAGKLTSQYGWRSDPFDGTPRFHSGVDILAAYGREVPAAGEGLVVFSGAQGGYGNTVVVEHANGVRTRYAHLSTIQVEPGASVQAGTVIGRVGSSGRSTGPHLHFEVLRDGQPVDPEVAATRYAGMLKLGGVGADYLHSQPSAHGVAAGVDDEDPGQQPEP